MTFKKDPLGALKISNSRSAVGVKQIILWLSRGLLLLHEVVDPVVLLTVQQVVIVAERQSFKVVERIQAVGPESSQERCVCSVLED